MAEPQSPGFRTERPSDAHSSRWSNPYRQIDRRIRALVTELVAATQLDAAATVVDYGCADRPYADLFAGRTVHGVDLPGNPDADVVLRADGTVPLPDAVADLVVSTQVLEHVVDPARYLAECARLLQPGGHLVLTTHGIMHLHRDPTDFWRWTADGLAVIVERAGLEVVRVDGALGLIGTALQLLQMGLLPRTPAPLRRPLIGGFQAVIALVDRGTTAASSRDNGMVLGVLARRPPRSLSA